MRGAAREQGLDSEAHRGLIRRRLLLLRGMLVGLGGWRAVEGRRRALVPWRGQRDGARHRQRLRAHKGSCTSRALLMRHELANIHCGLRWRGISTARRMQPRPGSSSAQQLCTLCRWAAACLTEAACTCWSAADRAAPGMGRGAGVVLGYSFWYSATCVSIRFWVSLRTSRPSAAGHRAATNKEADTGGPHLLPSSKELTPRGAVISRCRGSALRAAAHRQSERLGSRAGDAGCM